MRIPKLNPKIRKREYEAYNDDQRAQVVRGWLFDGKTHRQLDNVVLGLDPKVTKGYQSMGILHYLGLTGEFRGLFRDMSQQQIVAALESDSQSFDKVLSLLGIALQTNAVSQSALIEQEQLEVYRSLKDSSATRRKRIADRLLAPDRLQVFSYVYRRNPDIVAEALIRANGSCELCGSFAPFVRCSDGSPFLEVHHIVELARDGLDSLDNVAALCPNCHREAHLGVKAEAIRASLAAQISAKEAENN